MGFNLAFKGLTLVYKRYKNVLQNRNVI